MQLEKLSPKSKKQYLETFPKSAFVMRPSGAIYGSVAGLFDYGPFGTALKRNIEREWRKVFVDGFLPVHEVSTSLLLPEAVFQASGHLEKFSDIMISDEKTGDVFRADKFLSDWAAKRKKPEPSLNTLAEVSSFITANKVLSPLGNPFTAPTPFNLMFGADMGPTGRTKAFLRPETAQGIFTNFPELQRVIGKPPFGVAQIGKSFRNEISPRGGLLRSREFEQAELEFFYTEEVTEETLFL